MTPIVYTTDVLVIRIVYPTTTVTLSTAAGEIERCGVDEIRSFVASGDIDASVGVHFDITLV